MTRFKWAMNENLMLEALFIDLLVQHAAATSVLVEIGSDF